VKFTLPRKNYFLNSNRITAIEEKLMTKYPDIEFDFDLEFNG
jgi:hypothetical protein